MKFRRQKLQKPLVVLGELFGVPKQKDNSFAGQAVSEYLIK